MQKLKIDYQPRDAFIPFHKRTQKRAVLIVHRRGGKTVATINDLGAKAMYSQHKNPRYAYIAPFYRQAEDIAWTYLKDFLRPVIKKVVNKKLRVVLLNDAWITLYGADKPDAMRGLYFDGVSVDEMGDCKPSLYEDVILPTLAERRGWAVFKGTPKGKNHLYKLYENARKNPDWFTLKLPASKSGILAPDILQQFKDDLDEDAYAQEFECSFEAAVRGAYYTKVINSIDKQGQISDNVHYDPNQSVSIATDLGFTDSTAIWFFQKRAGAIACIDYEESNSEDLQFYIDLLRDKPYEYDNIWLPHDAVAATFQTGRSTLEQFMAEFSEDETSVRIAPKLAIQDGVNAARKILKHTWFHATKCYDGLEALRAYRRGINARTNVLSNTPLHDWASHGADAFRYLALVAKMAPSMKADIKKQEEEKYVVHLEQLWQDRMQQDHSIVRL